MKKAIFMIFWIFALSVMVTSVCLAWQGKVVEISDGDTITVMHDGRGVKIRVYGIDAPEKGQAFGNRAKQYASALFFGKTVDVDPVDMDKYGRTVAIIRVGDKNFSEEMIKAGYAWVYRKYCNAPACSHWIGHEHDAKSKGVGLWTDSNPTPPWEYRKKKIKRGE